MSFESHRFINDVEVREGAEITELYSTQPVLGRRVKVGGRCEGVRPETWRGVVTADGLKLWESPTTVQSFEEADRTARSHVKACLDRAIQELFA